MKTIINLTPHPVNIVLNSEVKRVFKPEGLARLKAEPLLVGEINSIPITKTDFGEPEGLPDEKDGVYYIVSQIVKSALPDRKDLLVPSQVVRDKEGNIIGCESLGI